MNFFFQIIATVLTEGLLSSKMH